MKKLLIFLTAFVSLSCYAQIPKSGLVLYYTFNGNANDESGNNINASVVNAIPDTDRFGNLNSAYSFDGNSGTERYIQSNIGQHDTISFSVWFKSKYPTTMYPNIFTYGTANRLACDIYGNHPNYISNGTIGDISTGSVVGGTWTTLISSNFKVADFLWHHAVVCFVPSDSVYFYFDNKLVGTEKYTANNPSDDLLFIGRQINDNAGSVMHETHFNGSIDDMRIYNRKLNKLEITNLFYEGKCFTTVYDTTKVVIYDTIHVTIKDTTHLIVHDTSLISVSDTLIINAILTGINPPNNVNRLTVYPNPTKDYIFINTGNYSNMTGYSIKISNLLGASVFETQITEQLYKISLSNLTGKGVYLLQITDNKGNEIVIRKIILQ